MPPDVTMEKDEAFAKTSDYCWVNVVTGATRVGKVRMRPGITRVIIYSINIFPEFRNRGHARSVVEALQRQYKVIIADRVRSTAAGFWTKTGFRPNGDGNYVWKKKWQGGAERRAA